MKAGAAYLAAAFAIAALTWWLVASPRIELAQAQRATATAKIIELQLLDDQRVALIKSQQLQIIEVTENERRNRELLQTIAGQSRAQSRAIEELKRNDETIAEYLRAAVPVGIGRLYERPATTDPGAYRQSPSVPASAVQSSSAESAADK